MADTQRPAPSDPDRSSALGSVGADVMLANGTLSAINGATLARSAGDAYEDCAAITTWTNSISVGERHSGETEADRPLLPGDHLCVRTTGGHVVGFRATAVGPYGDTISITGSTWQAPADVRCPSWGRSVGRGPGAPG